MPTRPSVPRCNYCAMFTHGNACRPAGLIARFYVAFFESSNVPLEDSLATLRSIAHTVIQPPSSTTRYISHPKGIFDNPQFPPALNTATPSERLSASGLGWRLMKSYELAAKPESTCIRLAFSWHLLASRLIAARQLLKHAV